MWIIQHKCLQLLSSAFELLQGATIFNKPDLQNAYQFVRFREGDEWKAAFNTHLGHFEYLVMPISLTNVPAMYQVLVNDILRDFINRFIFIYLDAILIFSKSVSENKSHIRQILLMPPGEQTLCQRRKVRTSCRNCLCPWLHCTAGQSLAEPNESESSG